MWLVSEEKSYIKGTLVQGYGRVVQVPEPENCFLDNNMIKEKECVKIEYDNQQMVDDLVELYARGAIQRVDV